MAWCNLWRDSWGFRSSARSTTGSATPTSRTVAPLRPRPKPRPSIYRPGSQQERSRPGSRGRRLRRVRCFRPPSGAAFSARRSTTAIRRYADPRASGNLGGFQGGIDLLRGSLIAGQYERTGIYGAYGDVSADVNGLVTNSAATAYVITHTGSINSTPGRAGHTGPMSGRAAGISTRSCRRHL